MKIYHYDPNTMEYLNEGIADLSPLEKDVWLIPGYATCEKPPELMEGKIIVFNVQNNQWEYENIPEPPEPTVPSPSELEILGSEVAMLKLSNITKDNIINTLGQEITKIKIQLLQGGM